MVLIVLLTLLFVVICCFHFTQIKKLLLNFPLTVPVKSNSILENYNKFPTATFPHRSILGELLKLGYEVSETTVAKYMPKEDKPSSLAWRSFLTNHIHKICSCDFFVVPTLTFGLLYVFVVLSHDRRKIVHINVTKHPTAEWTGQQIREAFPWDTTPKYLIRDNDKIYGVEFTKVVNGMGINEVKTAIASPWKNAYCERVIGSIRRECTDHIIPLSERHLLRVLKEYVEYYNTSRTHLSLEKDAPNHREAQTQADGDKIVSIPILGGLHHRYERVHPERSVA